MTAFPIVTVVKAEHCRKAATPIDVNDDGKSIRIIAEHSVNT
jgi:hypothetical protein